MKRIAVLTMLMAVGTAAAGDAPAGTAVGPVSPQVAAPVYKNGVPLNPPVDAAGPRLFSLSPGSLFKTKADAPPPVAQHPMPPLPTALAAAPDCGPAGCAAPMACAPRGSCLERLKKWMCFKPCPTDIPRFVPTPCYAPAYAHFLCTEKAGNCGTAGCDRPRLGGLLGGRAKKAECAPDCDPKAGPVNTGLSGYRFAAAENPAVGGAPVASSSFRMPAYGVKGEK